jgi:uncharacterized protein (DUF427 family)
VVKAIWNDALLAESDATIVVEDAVNLDGWYCATRESRL